MSGSRYFHTVLGRWTRRDPVGERGGRNVFAFALNSPVDLVDALGHTACQVKYDYNSTQPPGETQTWAGWTHAILHFNYNPRSCGFLSRKKKRVDYLAQCFIHVQFPSSEADSSVTMPWAGITPRQHEDIHVDVGKKGFKLLDGFISGYIGACVCPPCYDAQEALIDKYIRYINTSMERDNTALDCRDWPQNPEKTAECNRLPGLDADKSSQLADVNAAYDDMVNVCGPNRQ